MEADDGCEEAIEVVVQRTDSEDSVLSVSTLKNACSRSVEGIRYKFPLVKYSGVWQTWR